MKNKKLDYAYLNGKYPKGIGVTINKTNLKHLYDLVTERYSIYRQRAEHIPPPWTLNPILSKYKFTNVRREHDKTTIWYIKNIASNPNLSYKDKILRTIPYRLYNKIQTAEMFGLSENKKIDKKSCYEALKSSDSSYKVYTNAYLSSGLKRCLRKYFNNTPVELLPMRLMNHIDRTYNIESIFRSFTLASDCTDWFANNFKGIGNFMSYQIFVDYSYISEFPFSENEYVVAGLGAIKGLQKLIIKKNGMNNEQLLFWLRDNLEELFQQIDSEFSCKKLFSDLPVYDRKFNVMCVQNCMCELSKYLKVIEGTGRPRNVYKWRGIYEYE